MSESCAIQTAEHKHTVPNSELAPLVCCAASSASLHQANALLDSDGQDDTDLDLDVASDTQLWQDHGACRTFQYQTERTIFHEQPSVYYVICCYYYCCVISVIVYYYDYESYWLILWTVYSRIMQIKKGHKQAQNMYKILLKFYNFIEAIFVFGTHILGWWGSQAVKLIYIYIYKVK